jgi:GntR family transcriptional repressor for pyruvate dehydrogenase complex
MFDTVKSNKVSEHIIDQIRKAILEGRLQPGSKLPSEKRMMEEFNVSKATLREALRSLEVLGFLEIRKGALGGAFITEVDMKKANDFLKNFLHFKNLSLENLTEVRLLLEPSAAEKAALAITQEDLEKLRRLIEECESLLGQNNLKESNQHEVEFHRIIGSVNGNPILMFILDFVENLLIDTKEVLKPGKNFSEEVLEAHNRIYQALLSRDPQKTREEMIQHIHEVDESLLALKREGTLRETTRVPSSSTF